MPNILIVDDDRETCTFMTELLAQPDREILTAHAAVVAVPLPLLSELVVGGLPAAIAAAIRRTG